MDQPEIRIKPQAKCNSLFITLLGFSSLLLAALMSQYYWQSAKFFLMLMIGLSLAVMTLGILKMLEPETSFYISPQKLLFQHRKGRWQLNWQNIRAIHPVTNTHGIVREELNYIGLTLNSLEDLKDYISLRLANHLIHEQQPLMVYCVSHELIKPEQAIVNFEVYKCRNGEEIKGPLAGFLHQCQILKQALGAHLFIANGTIDRPLNDFAVLLRECKAASVSYQQQESA